MVENVDPNAGTSSKIMKDGGRLLLHRKGSSTIPSNTSLYGSCFGSRAILGDETLAKGGMLVPLNEVVKSSTHRLKSIVSDGSNLMIEEEYGNKNDGGSTRVSESRQNRRENVDLSNENIRENLMPRKPKGSSIRFVHGGGMEEAWLAKRWLSVQGRKVPLFFRVRRGREMLRANVRVKEVGDLMTEEPAIEAPVNGGRNYNGPKEYVREHDPVILNLVETHISEKAANKLISQIGFPNFHRVEANDLTEGIRVCWKDTLKFDHRPLLINLVVHKGKNSRPSKFFSAVVRTWNTEDFGNIFEQKKKLIARILGVQKSMKVNDYVKLHKLDVKLCAQLEHILDQEELL
ncbi:hypothetical protein Goshw_030243 [Gossypium schwendimanii]|uniref:DUF4283 domain-containing protein n=1 Tax=Gossypium schwendimanii TaxID=34291 RepID=A0A7J9MF37_GOSSC|nr:hypothetical protein [Gossypium schwendimanii]